MTAYGLDGGYVEVRIGVFVAGGWCARKERRSADD
jgi:hypothetical protein